MFRNASKFVSAALGFTLAVSGLMLSTPFRVGACPPPPESLFSLYMKSDLVVLAEVRSERDLKITDEDEDSFDVEVERSLGVVETFKGTKLLEIPFTRIEHRAIPDPENGEGVRRVFFYGGYGRNSVYQISVGSRYLFFMNRDPETGKYDLSSYQGIRGIGDQTEDIYRDRFAELAALLARKENQQANFAEWLVRLIEEQETLWDGAYVLSRSFHALEYNENNPEIIEDEPTGDEYGFYSSGIAKRITESQKARLSQVLYNSLSAAVDSDGELAEFNLIRIVSSWDKQRLAMYAFGLLQNTDPNNTNDVNRYIGLVANVIRDETLNDLFWQFLDAGQQDSSEIGAEIAAATEEEKQIDSSDYMIDESDAQPTAGSVSLESDSAAEYAADEPTEVLVENLTPMEMRQKLLGDFVNRYHALLAMNFQEMPEDQ